ncbi:MAG: hypothetical protein ABIP39_04500 [Polyangiaceae bacterium]
MRIPEMLRSGIVFAAIASSATAGAKEHPVALGEVSTAVVRGDRQLDAMLRATLEKELGELDFSRVRGKAPAILSVSLVRMDSEATSKGKVATCVVSATLRTARGGAIFAILEGRSHTEDGAPSRIREESLIKSAVHGALGRVPEALK